jgi:metal transporter CNNM
MAFTNEHELKQQQDCEFFTPWCEPSSFYTYLSISLLLITAAGMMAGLTMGLLSLDKLNMMILQMEGTDSEKKYAKKVLPILNQHHFLLVTLLLVNAGANEALPIFLNKLVPEALSILLSVTCVLLFGEILPSAIFTGPNQLKIAAFFAPIVRGLMVFVSPVAYPISKILDWCLGDDHEVTRYKRKELKALITLQRETRAHAAARRSPRVHSKEGSPFSSPQNERTNDFDRLSERGSYETFSQGGTPHQRDSFVNSAQSTRLHIDEVTIIHGALDLTAKTLRHVMIPFKRVYMLEYDAKLDENRMADILASGHSRIPVYKKYPSNIVGLLLVKRLIVVDPEDCRAVGDFCIRKPLITTPDESCYSILNEFQKGRSHIAMLTSQAKLVHECWEEGLDIPPSVEFVGIVTIEDVIEELIQEEIEDETDVYVHDIVNHWKRRSLHLPARHCGINFIKKKLHTLAEKARQRVRERKIEECNATSTTEGRLLSRSTINRSMSSSKTLEEVIEVTVVSEKTPLLLSFKS